MRCQACCQPMRPVSRAQVNVVVPLALTLAGLGGATYLALLGMAPVAGSVALLGTIGAVLIARMQREGLQCESCGATEPLDAQSEAQWLASEKANDRERMRHELAGQIAAQLRPALEHELRPRIEEELRPQLIAEL